MKPELSHSDTMNYVRKIVNYMELHYMEEIKARDYARSYDQAQPICEDSFRIYQHVSIGIPERCPDQHGV